MDSYEMFFIEPSVLEANRTATLTEVARLIRQHPLLVDRHWSRNCLVNHSDVALLRFHKTLIWASLVFKWLMGYVLLALALASLATMTVYLKTIGPGQFSSSERRATPTRMFVLLLHRSIGLSVC